VHEERQHADRHGIHSGGDRRHREESIYPYGSYGGLSPEGGVYDDRDRQAFHDRGPNRGRGPRGYQRSDDRIREEVCERLTDAEDVDASEVEVMVSNCEVALSGSVRTCEQKRRAIDIAEDVSGVHHVRSSLKIG
jgi:osmotically-inducible protein OsmY